jgi:ABC-2 type transport system permease protein
MKPYLAILTSRFLTLLQYRAAALAGIATQLFFGFVRIMIYDGFFRSSHAPQPLTLDQVTTYVWLGQAMLLLVMLDVDRDVAAMIRTGSVAYEMTKPLDLYNLWFVRAIGGRAAPLSMRSIPIFIVAGLFLDLQKPSSWISGLLFVVSTFSGLFLAASIVALLTISLLWTVSGEGISRLASPLIFFFSGIVIPVPMFPDWAQPLITVMPFRGLIDTPFRIYLGVMTGTAALQAILHQLVWVIALVILGRLILTRGLRRLVVQGG